MLLPFQETFKTWNDALKQKDFDKVAALYSSSDLSFLPTVSPKFIRDPHSTKEYFMEFLKKLPDGTITSDNVQRFGSAAYLHTGLYTFMTGPAENRQPVEARFSYMWRKVDEAWKIVHHHSSALPNAAAAAAQDADLSEDMYPIAQASCKIHAEPHMHFDFKRLTLACSGCSRLCLGLFPSLFKTSRLAQAPIGPSE
jgi:uncharacterized protein (TIGR02246 family)